jgi:predicted kinase
LSGIDERGVRALAAWLAERHARRAPSSLEAGIDGLRRDLSRDADEISLHLPQLADAELGGVRREQELFLKENGRCLLEREPHGWVRETAERPLRLEDVTISAEGVVTGGTAPPCPLVARDVCTDLASLAVDVSHGGPGEPRRRPELAERLLSAYAAQTGDFGLYAVIDFYEWQAAVQRALEEIRTTRPGSDPEAMLQEVRRWLLLALATRRDPMLPPLLVVVGGLVASGKSTVAKWLAGAMGAPRIEADRARVSLAESDPDHALEPDFADGVYRELVHRAEAVLASGRPVVLDGCFPQRSQRAVARDLARERGWPFLFIECRVDPATAQARLDARDAVQPSGRRGWKELYADLARTWEATDDLSADELLLLDCSRPLSESEACLAERIPLVPERHSLP